MAKVSESAVGYKFEGLSATGVELINEFEKNHRLLCEPSSQPALRFIRRGSPEENRSLEELVARVKAEDPQLG